MSQDTDIVTVMRYPVVMEDEGRHEYIMTTNRITAKEWIANQKDQYFKPFDYYIAENRNNNGT
jgi:hypothetical protein